MTIVNFERRNSETLVPARSLGGKREVITEGLVLSHKKLNDVVAIHVINSKSYISSIIRLEIPFDGVDALIDGLIQLKNGERK